MKKYILIAIALLPVISFAAWTQPTATPPAGNTQPPINVGTLRQDKNGIIGAKKFCLFNTDICLGGDTTNTGINTTKLCVGDKCITNWSDLSKSTIINNTTWTSIFNENGAVVAGDPKFVNYLTKWTNITKPTIANSNFYEETGKLCIGTGLSKICFGNGTDGTPGVPGIPGADGTILKCGSADSGKVLQWNGTNWICGMPEYKATDGTDGTPGIPGVAGKDGTYLSCGPADSGKVLKWNGTGWVCGTNDLDSVVSNGANTGRRIGVGGINIVDGTQGAGKVLTSDSSGKAAWASPSSFNMTFSCPSGQFLTGLDNGQPVCANPPASTQTTITQPATILPGTRAGYCFERNSSNYQGNEPAIVSPAIQNCSGGFFSSTCRCSCLSGWTISKLGTSYGSALDAEYTCIKN